MRTFTYPCLRMIVLFFGLTSGAGVGMKASLLAFYLVPILVLLRMTYFL